MRKVPDDLSFLVPMQTFPDSLGNEDGPHYDDDPRTPSTVGLSSPGSTSASSSSSSESSSAFHSSATASSSSSSSSDTTHHDCSPLSPPPDPPLRWSTRATRGQPPLRLGGFLAFSTAPIIIPATYK
ncbi:unnamed protein product [Linum trigynum]|uniref:Uncharacterized protein n=1 Tax=Linum trigynum TaxID=586398 RepID=A0AAV2EP18_9ROSI